MLCACLRDALPVCIILSAAHAVALQTLTGGTRVKLRDSSSPGKDAASNSILFYIPWASHNTNSVLGNQDGIGPLRRGQIMVSCTSLSVLATVASPKQNPTLATLVQLLGVPDKDEVCGKGARK